MTQLKHMFAGLVFLLMIGLSAPLHVTPQTGAVAKGFDAHPVTWKRLLYRANHIFGNLTTEVQLDYLPARLIGDLLIKTSQGEPIQPVGQHIGSITVRSVINTHVGSNSEIVSDSLFNLNDASALRRIRQLKGKEFWQKTYRFTQGGVYRLRKRPNGPDEADQGMAYWTDIKESFYPYGSTSHGCLQVVEPSTLLYIFSSVDFSEEGDTLNLCVFDKKQVHDVHVRKHGHQRQTMSYEEILPQNNVIKNAAKIETLKISMTSRPLVGETEAAETFSFLGLKGDIEFLIDPASRIPVQISGRIPYVGQLDFKLEKVWLRSVGPRS